MIDRARTVADLAHELDARIDHPIGVTSFGNRQGAVNLARRKCQDASRARDPRPTLGSESVCAGLHHSHRKRVVEVRRERTGEINRRQRVKRSRAQADALYVGHSFVGMLSPIDR